MANNAAIEFLKKVFTDEMLEARLHEKGPGEAVAVAAEMGIEVTEEELLAAEQMLRKGSGPNVEELDEADMDLVAGGARWQGDDAPDGHEMGCERFFYGYETCKEKGYWCTREYYRISNCKETNIMTDAALCRKYMHTKT